MGNLLDRGVREPTDADAALERALANESGADKEADKEADRHAEEDAEEQETSGDKPESPPAGPTTVTLPDGDTVTAASPQLAAAIKAAVGGTPIAEAFRQQGITIPAPGTAVTEPLIRCASFLEISESSTDRHALALGHGKALFDGQIQHIATVTGPSFLGWEHPPRATATAPARTGPPTPTRPAATSTTGD